MVHEKCEGIVIYECGCAWCGVHRKWDDLPGAVSTVPEKCWICQRVPEHLAAMVKERKSNDTIARPSLA